MNYYPPCLRNHPICTKCRFCQDVDFGLPLRSLKLVHRDFLKLLRE